VASSKGPSAGAAGATGIRPTSPAAELVGRRLQWLAGEVALRRDEVARGPGAGDGAGPDEAVHRMRVATRRLRSLLRTFGSLLEPGTAARLEPELRRLAGVLGPVRDQEVLLERLRHQLTTLVDSQVPAAVHRGLESLLGARIAVSRQEALAALGDGRCARLLEQLDNLAADPPWAGDASLPAAAVLPPLVRRDHRRLSRRVDRALAAPPGTERDQGLHTARKAAKRARYGVEALEAAWDGPARRYVRALAAIQDVLGGHHDAVVAEGFLRHQAESAGDDAAFAYGLLAGMQRAAAHVAERRLPGAWREAQRRRPSRWM